MEAPSRLGEGAWATLHPKGQSLRHSNPAKYNNASLLVTNTITNVIGTPQIGHGIIYLKLNFGMIKLKLYKTLTTLLQFEISLLPDFAIGNSGIILLIVNINQHPKKWQKIEVEKNFTP